LAHYTNTVTAPNRLHVHAGPKSRPATIIRLTFWATLYKINILAY